MGCPVAALAPVRMAVRVGWGYQWRGHPAHAYRDSVPVRGTPLTIKMPGLMIRKVLIGEGLSESGFGVWPSIW